MNDKVKTDKIMNKDGTTKSGLDMNFGILNYDTENHTKLIELF